jgi:hypothetical protein
MTQISCYEHRIPVQYVRGPQTQVLLVELRSHEVGRHLTGTCITRLIPSFEAFRIPNTVKKNVPNCEPMSQTHQRAVQTGFDSCLGFQTPQTEQNDRKVAPN